MKLAGLDWRILVPVAAALLIAIAAIIYWLVRRPRDPDEQERKRRAYLNKVGRICEGQIVELVERGETPGNLPVTVGRAPKQVSQNGASARRLVCYTYAISGVTYETAQDITGLEARIHLNRLASGQPASVKYDAANPTNSILIAEDWSGLR